MQHSELRSHELRIRVDLDDIERFAHHKRFSGGITIAVNQVRVEHTFVEGSKRDQPFEPTHVRLYGNGILKDGNLGAERDDRHASLKDLPPKIRRIVDARIAAFHASFTSAP